MSQLTNVKAQIAALAAQAKTLSGQLAQFKTQFGRTANQVQATIGGSAQGKDRELLQAVQAAQKQVEAAAAMMATVEQKARQYGASL